MHTANYRIPLNVWVQFSLVISPLHMAFSEFIVSDSISKKYEQLADLNLGILLTLSETTHEGEKCADRLYASENIHLVHAMIFAVQKVNEDYNFSKIAKLGYVIMDDCTSESQTLTKALSFMTKPTCSLKDKGSYMHSYDVIGVIGSYSSSQSIVLSQLLSSMRIPVISFKSTSDDLSDKASYPNFFRTLAPDKYQFEAIASLLYELGWTYLSVVYIEGDYGENAATQLRNSIMKKDMCFAAAIKISILISTEEIKMVVRALVEKQTARAVVIIANPDYVARLMEEARNLLPRTFIWIGPDAWSEEITAMYKHGELILGSVLITPYMSTVNKFYKDYFQKLTVKTTNDPWFKEFWEESFNCSHSKNTCSTNQSLVDKPIPTNVNRIIDTVNVYANATNRVLNGCTKLSSAAEARLCITGPKLMAELKKTNQIGLTGRIKINDQGERLNKYIFLQVVLASEDERMKTGIMYTTEEVASYDPESGKISMQKMFTWEYHSIPQNHRAPESRCSEPCGPGEVKIIQAVSCCWTCQQCRLNEHAARNRTWCEACPLYFWPDSQTNASTCTELPVDTPSLMSAIGMIQAALSFTLFLACLGVLIVYLRNREHYLISKASPEVSFLMLLAIGFGIIVELMLHITPDEVICRLSFALFCLSFTLLYVSLFFRALSLYYTSKSYRERQPILPIMSRVQQLIFFLGIILVQVVLCSVMMIVYPTWQRKTMKEVLKPYVELNCVMHDTGMLLFLIYNLLMVVASACLTFKTSQLKVCYSESRNISLFISITVVIWAAMIPPYMVAAREYLKTLLLTLTLTFNQAAVLFLLFLPTVNFIMSYQDETEVETSQIRSLAHSLVPINQRFS